MASPKIHGPGTASRSYTLCASTMDLWKEKKRKKSPEENCSIHSCYTSSDKNCTVEVHLISEAGYHPVSHLIMHFLMLRIEIHLACLILWACPSFTHGPVCWNTLYSRTHPTSLGHLQKIFQHSADIPHLGTSDASFKLFLFLSITRLCCRHTSHLITNLDLGKKKQSSFNNSPSEVRRPCNYVA